MYPTEIEKIKENKEKKTRMKLYNNKVIKMKRREGKHIILLEYLNFKLHFS